MPKIIQISAAQEGDGFQMVFALDDEGTVWDGTYKPTGEWMWRELAPLPDNEPRWFITEKGEKNPR